MKKLLPFIIAIAFYGSAYSQITHKYLPEADFMVNRTKIMENDSVQFTDLSGNSPANWHWKFEGGDPATSSEQFPVVKYPLHGTYTVILTVTNNWGQDSIIKYQLMHVHTKQWGDTLNYPLPGDTTVLHDSCGFPSGTNCKKNKAVANYFHFVNSIEWFNVIEGGLFWFAKASGDTSDLIKFCVWDTTGPGGSPGNLIDSNYYPCKLGDIQNDILLNRFTDIFLYHFIDWYVYEYAFYMGYELPSDTLDTLALVSNRNGDSVPGLAWEQWNDGTWHRMSDTNSWGLNISLGIFTMMGAAINNIQENTVDADLPVWPNPAKDILHINVPGGNSATGFEVTLTDMTGRILIRQMCSNSVDAAIDVSGVSEGIYILSVKGDSRIYTRQISILSD